jgi:NAD+--asparagine ADP-ribosyltransferase
MSNSRSKNEDLDFSNKESQKLFEEYTLFLADITEYIESREKRIGELEKEIKEKTRIRNMVKLIFEKLFKYIKKKIKKFINFFLSLFK